jgi:GxxExxY protein
MDESDAKHIANVVRQTAYEIHVYHGHGHLERIYETALVHRLRKRGLVVAQQVPVEVFDEDGTSLGRCLIDLLVEGILIVEIKAARHIAAEHVAQLLGYLKSTRLQHGLLINFGSYRFEIRKLVASSPRNRHAPRDISVL